MGEPVQGDRARGHASIVEFKGGAKRAENRKQLNVEIEKTLVGKTSAEWIEILNKAGVPCGPIYNVGEVFSDPQVQHLGVATEVEHAKLGRFACSSRPRAVAHAGDGARADAGDR